MYPPGMVPDTSKTNPEKKVSISRGNIPNAGLDNNYLRLLPCPPSGNGSCLGPILPRPYSWLSSSTLMPHTYAWLFSWQSHTYWTFTLSVASWVTRKSGQQLLRFGGIMSVQAWSDDVTYLSLTYGLNYPQAWLLSFSFISGLYLLLTRCSLGETLFP